MFRICLSCNSPALLKPRPNLSYIRYFHCTSFSSSLNRSTPKPAAFAEAIQDGTNHEDHPTSEATVAIKSSPRITTTQDQQDACPTKQAIENVTPPRSQFGQSSNDLAPKKDISDRQKALKESAATEKATEEELAQPKRPYNRKSLTEEEKLARPRKTWTKRSEEEVLKLKEERLARKGRPPGRVPKDKSPERHSPLKPNEKDLRAKAKRLIQNGKNVITNGEKLIRLGNGLTGEEDRNTQERNKRIGEMLLRMREEELIFKKKEKLIKFGNRLIQNGENLIRTTETFTQKQFNSISKEKSPAKIKRRKSPPRFWDHLLKTENGKVNVILTGEELVQQGKRLIQNGETSIRDIIFRNRALLVIRNTQIAIRDSKTVIRSIEKLIRNIKIPVKVRSGRPKPLVRSKLGVKRGLVSINPDDLINRMAPSLAKHVGCDVVDINPGNGLWSSKIHDFLKPRTHILLEPDYPAYASFLDPLLQAEGSTYQLFPKSGTTWAHLQKAILPENLPHQTVLKRGDERLHQPNDTLLLIANLAYNPVKPYRGFKSLTQLVLYQLLSAVRTHSLVHQYGLVRMLIWIAHEDKRSILTEGISKRKKGTVEAEITCGTILDVADTFPETHHHRVPVLGRDLDLVFQSSLATLGRMKEAGIEIPEHRQGPLQKETMQLIESAASESDYPNLIEKYKFANMKKKKKKGQSPHDEESGPPAQLIRSKSPRYLESIAKFEALSEMQERLNSSTASPEEKREQQDVIDREFRLWEDLVHSGSHLSTMSIMLSIENKRALKANPPVAIWDRRESEPLKINPMELAPQSEACLIDFRPKPLWPVLREDPLAWENLEFILGCLFSVPTQSLKNALKSLPPGAYEWIVPRCPSLTDPEKGGAMKLEAMTPRGLSEPIYEEILNAWMDWPFKPDRYQLMKLTGVGYDPEEAAEKFEKGGVEGMR